MTWMCYYTHFINFEVKTSFETYLFLLLSYNVSILFSILELYQTAIGSRKCNWRPSSWLLYMNYFPFIVCGSEIIFLIIYS